MKNYVGLALVMLTASTSSAMALSTHCFVESSYLHVRKDPIVRKNNILWTLKKDAEVLEVTKPAAKGWTLIKMLKGRHKGKRGWASEKHLDCSWQG